MAQLKDLIVSGAARFLGNLYGNLKGNADTATKATQDASGNIITATYATKSDTVTLSSAQIISGTKTFAAPANISQEEQTTTKFITANGGSVSIGKEAKNNGTMIRMDQADGTCRVIIRSSTTAGAMVWDQPEEGAKLFVDLGKQDVDKHRIQFPDTAGTLALNTAATASANGLMSKADKAKLDAVPSTYATKTELTDGLNAKAALNHTQSADSISGLGFLQVHPEGTCTIIPYLYNDLAHLKQRGGSCKIYATTSTDYTTLLLNEQALTVGNSDYMFNGANDYAMIADLGEFVAVIDIVLPKVFKYNLKFYIDFGAENWRAKNISVYTMLSTSDTKYVNKQSVTNNNKTGWVAALNAGSTGVDRLRVVLSGFANTSSASGKRIAQLGLVSFDTIGLAALYISRAGCSGIYGSLIPNTNNYISLGSSTKAWKEIYANTVYSGGEKVSVEGHTHTALEEKVAQLEAAISALGVWNGEVEIK